MGAVGSSAMFGARLGTDAWVTSPEPQGVGEEDTRGEATRLPGTMGRSGVRRLEGLLSWRALCLGDAPCLGSPLSWSVVVVWGCLHVLEIPARLWRRTHRFADAARTLWSLQQSLLRGVQCNR